MGGWERRVEGKGEIGGEGREGLDPKGWFTVTPPYVRNSEKYPAPASGEGVQGRGNCLDNREVLERLGSPLSHKSVSTVDLTLSISCLQCLATTLTFNPVTRALPVDDGKMR